VAVQFCFASGIGLQDHGEVEATCTRGHKAFGNIGCSGRNTSELRRSIGMAAPSEVNILGYDSFWLRTGEAHISTVAVRPEWRRGIGELLVAMLERAVEQ
jgi:ribosomal protein S18 acetylase RimI-like enzyme